MTQKGKAMLKCVINMCRNVLAALETEEIQIFKFHTFINDRKRVDKW